MFRSLFNKLFRRKYRHLTIVALVIIGILLTFSAKVVFSGDSATVEWQSAANYFSQPQLEKVLFENVTKDVAQEVGNKALVAELSSSPNPVIAINFNSQQVCGKLGCLYAVYRGKKEQLEAVFSRYLTTNQPLDVSVFLPLEEVRMELPCFQINQVVGEVLEQLKFCFDGDHYSLVEQKPQSLMEKNKPLQ